MLAEGLIHLRFMSPYALFFINKNKDSTQRFTPPNFAVCIMQYAEVLRQKVLKQRQFFSEKGKQASCFQTNEKLTELHKKIPLTVYFQWWSKLDNACI